MALAWNRAFLMVAAAAFSACTGAKSSDAGAEIPIAPPERQTFADAGWASAPASIPEEPLPTARSRAGARVHVVRKGDTLFSLARHYYQGDQSKWRRIWDANREQIPDRDKLKVGQELVIPD